MDMGTGDAGASPAGHQEAEIFGQLFQVSGTMSHKVRPADTGGDMNTKAELRCRCGEVRGVVADASPRTVQSGGLLLRRLPGVYPQARPRRPAQRARRHRYRSGGAGIADLCAGTGPHQGCAADVKRPLSLVCELLQHAHRQHAFAVGPFRWHRRFHLRSQQAARERRVRRTARRRFRQICHWQSAGRRCCKGEPIAAAAHDWQGLDLAAAR